MPCRAIQNERDIVESSDKMWSTGEGNGKPLEYSGLENPMNSMKRQKDRTLKEMEMARVSIDILGISELKWTGIREFNSDDHYLYYSGQESLRRNGVALIVNKRVQNTISKMTE